MADFDISLFKDGVHNMLDDESIPKSAAQDELNWITTNGAIELALGKVSVGPEGAGGEASEIWFGYGVDGSVIQYSKMGTAIRYFNTTTQLWVDVVTGLGVTDEYVFQNYSSLAGNFTFAFGPGGIFKMHNGNPGFYLNMYNSAVNFLGRGLIDKGRCLMGAVPKDPTGLYGSYIDAQNGTVYTTVTNEVLATGDGIQTVFSGILVFKGANPLANAFGLLLNMNPSGITATDDYKGVISGSGVSGTINYLTGAYTLTFTVPPAIATQVRVSYQWENSNSKGITDFTKSSPRQAGQGFVLRQDEGGDGIQIVVIGIDGYYYSIKKRSVYRYIPDVNDTSPRNEVFRRDLGVSYYKSVISTSLGIVILNMAKPDKPRLVILERNPIGDDLRVTTLMQQFKFENYDHTQAVVQTFGRYVVLSCKQINSIVNDRLLLVDLLAKTIDITHYGMRSLGTDAGVLYGGSPFTQTVYKIFNGFDDDGNMVENYWTGKGEKYGVTRLKKYRRLRLRGLIDPIQYYEVYASYDDGSYQLIGTVRGDASYVDQSNPATIGSSLVGDAPIGGGYQSSVNVFPYFLELKVKVPKFRKRTLKYIAKGFGYVSISNQVDHDVLMFEDRIPKRFRQKQNVSLDGLQTDIAPPQF